SRIGQPKTAPSMVKTIGRRRCGGGSCARVSASSAAAITPAMTARPVAVRYGLKPPTASLVSGTENENISTPANAHARPSRRTETGATAPGVVAASTAESVPTGAAGTWQRESSGSCKERARAWKEGLPSVLEVRRPAFRQAHTTRREHADETTMVGTARGARRPGISGDGGRPRRRPRRVYAGERDVGQPGARLRPRARRLAGPGRLGLDGRRGHGRHGHDPGRARAQPGRPPPVRGERRGGHDRR